MENKFTPTIPYTWDRYSITNGYEVSTKGDKRFSAFNAKLSDKSIEEIYQLDIKGYGYFHKYASAGKGKPPLEPINWAPKVSVIGIPLDDRSDLRRFLRWMYLMNRVEMANEFSDKTLVELRKSVKFNATSSDNLRGILLGVICTLVNWTEACTFIDHIVKKIEAEHPQGVCLFIPEDKLVECNVGAILQNNRYLANKLEDIGYVKVPYQEQYSEDLEGKCEWYVNLWYEYKSLWAEWFRANPELVEDLAKAAHGKCLTDMFATSPINQARALCELLNEHYKLS